MNIQFCQDCAFVKVLEKSQRRYCSLCHKNIRIQQIKQCPMHFDENELDWIVQKSNEDEKRGHALYVN